MMKRLPHVLLLTALLATPGGAQQLQTVTDGRVVSMSTVPESPLFGDVFDIRITIRLAPGVVALLPDTLLPTDVSESAGTGRWDASAGPADSVDVVAHFPVAAYGEGRVDLPSMEMWTRSTDDITARVLPAREAESTDGDHRHLVRLGAIIVPEFAAMADSGVAAVPRPAADVLGGEWSIWLLLAVGLLTAAGVGGAGRVVPHWWARFRGAFGNAGSRSPRERALRELEQIRSAGWHRNGRIDHFYASTTDVLRRFAGHLDPTWTMALTSTELLRHLESRPGAIPADLLRGCIDAAERAKFGSPSANAEQAEADWAAIRDWIRDAPERG